MVNYGLEGHDWFESMFEARKNWVPAYFRDFLKSGLVRTTSISESENCFYKRYTRSRSNLHEFWMNFSHALDAQRYAFSHMNYMDKSVISTLETKASFEKQVATQYSLEMFRTVQEEINSGWNNCCLIVIRCGLIVDEYKIKDEYGETCLVTPNREDDYFECCCKLFGRKGILCRHIFLVFKNKSMKHIPERYIIGRWRKFTELTPVHNVQTLDLAHYSGVSEDQQLTNKIYSSVFGWVHVIDGNNAKLSSFLSAINDACECVTEQTSQSIVNDKKKAFEKFYDAKVPEIVDVLPPDVVKTKGSGSRMISRKEKSAKMLLKPKRKCAKCKQLAYHDSRNCDKVAEKVKE